MDETKEIDQQDQMAASVRNRTFRLQELYALRSRRMAETKVHGDDETEKQILAVEAELRDIYHLPAILSELLFDDGTDAADVGRELLRSAGSSMFELRKLTMMPDDQFLPLDMRLQNPTYRKHAELLRDLGVHFAIAVTGPGVEPKAIRGELGEVHRDIRRKVAHERGSGSLAARPDASGIVVDTGDRVYFRYDSIGMIWPEGLITSPGTTYLRDSVNIPLVSSADTGRRVGSAVLVGDDFHMAFLRPTDNMQRTHAIRFNNKEK